MDATFDLDAAAQAVTTAVSNVSNDQLGGPTPCPDYDVADLLFHILGRGAAFRAAAEVALDELAMHGWDIAKATGQDFALPEQTLQVSHDLLYPGTDQSEREPIFGPVVQVPEGALLLDKVIGLGGRDPAWTP